MDYVETNETHGCLKVVNRNLLLAAVDGQLLSILHMIEFDRTNPQDHFSASLNDFVDYLVCFTVHKRQGVLHKRHFDPGRKVCPLIRQ